MATTTVEQTSPGAAAGPAPPSTTTTATFRVWRGDAAGGAFRDYVTEVTPGMVVLDAIHQIQARHDSTLACRWNCKAAKCGSCSAEIDGKPKLMCKSRIDEYPAGVITVGPMRAFPLL